MPIRDLSNVPSLVGGFLDYGIRKLNFIPLVRGIVGQAYFLAINSHDGGTEYPRHDLDRLAGAGLTARTVLP